MNDERLEGLIWQDTFAAIVALMTPDELMIAALRLEGLNDKQIAALLALDRSTVARQIACLQQRIAREMPEMASFLAGRQRQRRVPAGQTVLGRGWVCKWES